MKTNHCKTIFIKTCKLESTKTGITANDTIRIVWGEAKKEMADGPKDRYRYFRMGHEGNQIKAHCIWCARTDALLRGYIKSIIETETKPNYLQNTLLKLEGQQIYHQDALKDLTIRIRHLIKDLKKHQVSFKTWYGETITFEKRRRK